MGIMKQREEHVANEIEAAENSRQEALKYLEEQREIVKSNHVLKRKNYRKCKKTRRNTA